MSQEVAILAGGCFWCTEAIYLDVAGVEQVESGYIGGQTTNPTYREVCGGNTGHAEAVKLRFDNDVIAYGDLLDIFFGTHDATQLNRQGGDVGTQYRSAIFPQSEEQRDAAEAAIARANAEQGGRVVTTIEPDAPWHVAEDSHQDYFARQGGANPYCQAVIAPKLQKFRKSYQARLKNAVA
ncbi:MAG: peptide-methionine (S)-S-oxide reductase MsrA [Pseudomonadota bacterium]|nr:peptide-methionine (S)-S-oxide reductase MsrA [Pseudomonadota bacterium]